MVDEARDDLFGGIRLSMIDRDDTFELMRRMERIGRAMLPAIIIGSRRRQSLDLITDAPKERLIVRDPDIGAAAKMHMHLRAADIERGDLLALRAFDKRRARDHHIGLLGHIDA